jgi:hypothetical protein
MTDVFISYAREDRARAEQVAQALNNAGLEAFWDSEIPPGQTWADYIENKLGTCKALVVLWSEHSTKSQWVREEARMAKESKKLIPAMLDATPAPFGFGEVQGADLSTWNGQADHPEWRRFLSAVAGAAGKSAAVSAASAPPRAGLQPIMSAPAPSSSVAEKKGMPGWAWALIAVVATIVVLGVIGNMSSARQQQQQAAAPQASAPQEAETPPAAGATAPAGGDNAQQIILAQLQQAQTFMTQQGYQQGQTWNIPVDLAAGVDYSMVGVCDRDCNDLDIALFDQSGQILAQDTSTDDHPVVNVSPAMPGRYMMQVRMYRCNVAPCYYAVALFGRQRQG